MYHWTFTSSSLYPQCDDVKEDDYVKTWDFDGAWSDSYDYTRKYYDTESNLEDKSDGDCRGNGSDLDEEEECTFRDDSPTRPILPPIKVPLILNRSPS